MTATRQWLLVGAGAAHCELLRSWARQPQAGVQITLITPQGPAWYAPRVAGLVAGHFEDQECQWPLEALVQRSGVQWLRAGVRALHGAEHTLELDDGRTLRFDWLSVHEPGVHLHDALDASLPGAREHALKVYPLAGFCKFWPQVLAMAQARPLRFTVVGAGITGCELALALQHRLPDASVTLLSGTQLTLARCSLGMQTRMLQNLKHRQITVLQDRALAVAAHTVRLGCGADLASDVTVLATATQLPRWLSDSGLTQDPAGQWTTGAAGPPPQTPRSGWQVLTCGNRSAMAGKGRLTFQGTWVWWWAHWRDQRLLRP